MVKTTNNQVNYKLDFGFPCIKSKVSKGPHVIFRIWSSPI